ncbi:MAG TPA: dinitrogenase iron-molybdenum cofactor biosynthesis protein [Erysipelotrichaceae bacterium]|jgi:predicted Fe-Mo cluster-binding NifX family protein|nr:dinitrogenase iron-molybdenum cofactor biosynthesis protein [Erysipelotrichaceae bacterium]
MRDVYYMKIAVSYLNKEVFDDFGTTPAFKLYEIHEQQVLKSTVVDTQGIEYGALAVFLDKYKVDLVLTGTITPGSRSACHSNNMEVVTGMSGNADDCVMQYLKER